jgi:phosphoribosylaminoimidazolecarboxamide formyltransferase / IMP cyclohydrolase
MADTIPVKRALLSVSDKTGLEQFATALHKEFGVQLISTGGTAAFLRSKSLPVTDVSEVTGFPEMMDGRLKTLHPRVHGGLLAVRDDPRHQADMRQHGIGPIDLLCVNLYPFAQTIAKPGVTLEEAIENIDIGGPAMIRSAAKNHRFVLVVTSPDRYEKVLGDLRKHNGASCSDMRLKQAQRAFAHTAEYDRTISGYLAGVMGDKPETLEFKLTRKQTLRYGENPHQTGALYVGEQPKEASVAFAKLHHGKELSYLNLLDADAALGLVSEFTEPAACIVKHATPCGCAVAGNAADAFKRAFEGDPIAAFGGIAAVNRPIDGAAAQAIAAIDKLMEVIVAPTYSAEGLEILKSRWKNVRLLEVGPMGGRDAGEIHLHKIVGGFLVQQRDLSGDDAAAWKVVSVRQPTAEEMADVRFAWLVCKHVKSNAIAICKNGMLLGAGAGQMDRPSAARLAIAKAGERAAGAAAASDAFFPFPDGPRLLLEAGVTAIIQPGGSVQDQQSIDAVNLAGAVMVFAGRRHFKH